MNIIIYLWLLGNDKHDVLQFDDVAWSASFFCCFFQIKPLLNKLSTLPTKKSYSAPINDSLRCESKLVDSPQKWPKGGVFMIWLTFTWLTVYEWENY